MVCKRGATMTATMFCNNSATTTPKKGYFSFVQQLRNIVASQRNITTPLFKRGLVLHVANKLYKNISERMVRMTKKMRRIPLKRVK